MSATTEPGTPAHSGESPIRVFLLDDHELVRRGLHDLMDGEPDVTVVGEAARAADAIRDIGALLPDVAILDLRLPDGSGVEVCRQIRTDYPSVACLILTSFDDRHALLAAIASGAAGYILKEIRSEDLLSAVRKAASGQSLLDPTVTSGVLGGLNDDIESRSQREGLTREEIAVLRLIAAGLNDRQIGERLFLPEKAVKIHVTRMLVKLGLGSSPTLSG